jgi:hypothetical protein
LKQWGNLTTLDGKISLLSKLKGEKQQKAGHACSVTLEIMLYRTFLGNGA